MGILMEWIHFMANAIAQGVADAESEMTTDLTSGVNREYHVDIRAAPDGAGVANIHGRIYALDVDGRPMLEHHARLEYDP